MRLLTNAEPRIRGAAAQRGTALVLAIVVSVVLSAFVMLLAWGEGLNNLSAAHSVETDEAFLAAESGAQRALWYWKHNNYTWNNSGAWSMTVSSASTGCPAVTWTQNYRCAPDSSVSGAYDISCTATNGITSALSTSAYACSFVAKPPTVSAPALFIGGNANISSSLTINGDFQTPNAFQNTNSLTVNGDMTTGGDLNYSPKVTGNLSVKGTLAQSPAVGKNLTVTGYVNGSPIVTGNLTYGVAVQGHPVVSGTTTHNASVTVTVPSTPDVTSMFNTVSAQATGAGVMTALPTILDFTKTTNNIIYIKNGVTIGSGFTIKGSGTVCVAGSWTQSANVATAAGQTLNIITTGGLTLQNGATLNITGSLYVVGNCLLQGGTYNITGVVVSTGDTNANSSGTITAASPPSFDPRSSGGSSAISETNFTAQ